jgi:DNA-directed RNA polymerase subunit RPC12/RpoP
MLNPGYRVIAKKQKMDCNPGPEFLCPICRHIILEADAEKFRVKCKHCGHWIYMEKLAVAG